MPCAALHQCARELKLRGRVLLSQSIVLANPRASSDVLGATTCVAASELRQLAVGSRSTTGMDD